MFSNITTSYDLSDATFEILFMLAITFLLGFLFAWLLKRVPNDTPDDEEYIVTDNKKIDNLKIIEWIGPKIETLLNDAGIHTFRDVIDSDIKWLQKILDGAGSKYQIHNPKTWPDQAELAVNGRWWELKEYQDLLNAGRES